MRLSFEPERDAFAFRNNFVNRISIAHLPISETRGRCGGMVFAALDHWHYQVPVPDTAELPPDGDPLADYIYRRQLTSIMANWAKFLQFMRTPDHPTAFSRGVSRMTREDEFPKLRRRLDLGLPQPLGLSRARDVRAFGDDHQVLAYGYEQDATKSRIFIWDNRYGRREDVLEFTTAYAQHDRAIRQSDGSTWRGLFVEQYEQKIPTYVEGRTR